MDLRFFICHLQQREGGAVQGEHLIMFLSEQDLNVRWHKTAQCKDRTTVCKN